MKKHAQAILQFTGYPLEPIVAFEVKKSFQNYLPALFNTPTPMPSSSQMQNSTYKAEEHDERWFSNYE